MPFSHKENQIISYSIKVRLIRAVKELEFQTALSDLLGRWSASASTPPGCRERTSVRKRKKHNLRSCNRHNFFM